MPFWLAPAECPQEPEFSAQVEHFLGQKLSSARQQSLKVSGEVTLSETLGYVARLRVQTPHGTQERELSHRDCSELTEAAALVTALAIDPQLALAERSHDAAAMPPREPEQPEQPARQEAAPAPPQPATPASTTASPDRPSARPGSPLRSRFALAGLFGNGVLPEVGVGLGARAQLARERFALRVQADYWLPRFLGINDRRSGPGLDLGAWGIGLMGCYLPRTGDVSLAACAGPLVGDMYGAGNSLLTNPKTSHRRWSAVAAELDVAVAPSSIVAGWFGIQLAKTLEAPRFGISEDSQPVELFAANSWSVSGLVGVGLSL